MRALTALATTALVCLFTAAALACATQPEGAAPDSSQTQIDPSLKPPFGAPEAEWRILVIFYNATGGPDWTNDRNWLTDEPLETWHGVSTNFGRVTGLTLFSNGLKGELPPELGGLSNLTELYLGNNQLTGEIPPELGNLTNLISLDLIRNQLEGEVPRDLFNLESLEMLDVSLNQVSGCAPGGREGVYFGGLPPCDPALAASAPTPPGISQAGPTPTLAPTPGQAATVTPVPAPRPVATVVPTVPLRPTRRATATPPATAAPTPTPQTTTAPTPQLAPTVAPTRAPTSTPTPTPAATLVPAPTPVPTPAPTARPATTAGPESLPPGAEPVYDILEMFAGSLKWIAHYDHVHNVWSLYDPTGSYSEDRSWRAQPVAVSLMAPLTHIVPKNS